MGCKNPWMMVVKFGDFNSALDLVNHEALTFKLRQMGISGTFLNMIIEFLTERKHMVVVDGQCSQYGNIISCSSERCSWSSAAYLVY